MKRKLLLAIFAVITVVANTNAQVPGYVPSTGLVGWWPFNGNGNDESTAGNDLTNYGATLTTDRFGTANSAYNFSGTSQYLKKDSPSFTFGSTSSFTVSYWLYKPSLSYGVTIMNSSGANGNFIWIFQTSAAGAVQFGTNKQGSAWTWAAAAYSAAQWVHVVGTYNNGTMTIYEDGSFVTTATYTHTGAATTNLPLWIGRSHGSVYHTGKIDDIGIWNRVLTQSEITSLYVGCNVGTVGQPVSVSSTIGASAEFGVSSTNSAVTYQWQSNGSGSFQDISNGGQFSGATSDTLMVGNLSMTNNGEMFRCVLTENSTCVDTSTAATLTVCGSLVGQPTNQSVNSGAMAKFGTASNDPTATFQWQLNAGTGFVSLTNGSQFMGTTTDTLTIAAATLSLSGKSFRCLSMSGACSDTSDEAILTVAAFGVDELSANNSVVIYPNPAQNVITVEVPVTLQSKDFAVFDQIGNRVLAGTLEGQEMKIDVSQLANGLYVMRIAEKYSQSFSIAK